MTMFKTEWKEYRDGAGRYRIQAEYGLDYDFARKHKQEPHFSLTGVTQELVNARWLDSSFGQLHTEIARHFPELARLIKWHLVSIEEPMHYLANGQYWWEIWSGKKTNTEYGPDPLEAFKSTIVWGALPGHVYETDTAALTSLLSQNWAEVKAWLQQRLPAVMREFMADMKAIDALEKDKHARNGSGGSAEFMDELRSLLDIGDRHILIRNKHGLGGPDAVYVNFVNLPVAVVGERGGGGAEAENNRTSFWIRGFDKRDEHAPPPTGKVKVELSNSVLPHSARLRAKTGTPSKIAQYLADYLNKVVREHEPHYTHSTRR